MGRPKALFPRRYWHKAARQWVVKLDGKTVYLGANDTAADARYRELIAERLTRQPVQPPPLIVPHPATVGEVLTAYAAAVKPRIDRRQLHRVLTAAKAVAARCGELPAARFDQLHLEHVRNDLLTCDSRQGGQLRRRLWELLAPAPIRAGVLEAQLVEEGFSLEGIRLARRALKVEGQRQGRAVLLSLPDDVPYPRPQPLSRHYVNALIGVIQTAWSWAVWKKLAPPGSDLALRSLKALRADEGGRETADVLPVADAVVAATLPFCGSIVAAMIRLQQWAGMRPGEVCRICPGAVSVTPTQKVEFRYGDTRRLVSALLVEGVLVWVFACSEHKTRRKGKARLIALGPRAQEVLRPYLDRPAGKPCFSPKESVDAWREAHGQALHYGQGREPGMQFTTASYEAAIGHAAVRAGVIHWTPNQLRHRAASDLSDVFDLATAQAALGHAHPDTTLIYALESLTKAARAAALLG